LGSNKGVKVILVVNDSPAFNNDVLVGDILLTINGRPIASPETLGPRFEELSGTTVELGIMRGEKSIAKLVSLNPGY